MKGKGIHRLYLIGAAFFTLFCEPAHGLAKKLEQPSVQLIVKTSPNAAITQVSSLQSKHYGKLLSWPEAKEIITMKSIISVVDLETGLQFEVQRRAGSTHADVQPLTKRDTEIMKQLYYVENAL